MNRIAAVAGVCLSMFANLSVAQVQPLNASFETPAVASGTRTASPAGSNWTFAGTAGIERFAPTFAYYGGGFTGDQVAYISATGNAASRGSVAQNVNFPSAGYYVVRFAAGRTGKNNGVQVSVGSTVVESEIVPNSLGNGSNPQFESWWTVPFYVGTAGVQEVKFTGTQSVKLADGDLVWLDQVTIASAPVALDNSSFENPAGWTLGNGASITASTKNGKVGGQLLRIPEAGGNALAAAKTFQAGTYALSLRMARTYAGTTPCGVGVYRQTASGFALLTTVPGARTDQLVPYTSLSFDLPAGTYSLYFSTSCAGSSGNDWDSLVLTLAAPNFGDPDFTTPDVGYPATPDDRPLVYQPVGSPWTYSGPAGIQGNPGAYWTNQPVTIRGHQYGYLEGTFARLDQSLTLTAGTYVLVAQASSGLYKVTINGQVESSIARGYSLTNGSSSNPGLDFGEVISAPFTIATSGPVTIGVRGAGGSTGLQAMRVLRVNTANPPPNVALAMTLNGNAITAPVPAGVTVRATATASDSDGLSLVRVLRDGTPLSPTSTTSPLAVDVTLSTPGATHVFVAEAIDTLGAVGTAPQTVTVLANSAPVITSFNVSPLTPQVAAAPLTLSATASDTDAYVSSIDYYWRNVDSVNPAQYINGQSCVNSSSAPVQPFSCNNKTWTPPSGTGGNYALSARATDNNAAANTSSEIVVSVCGPKVTLNSPSTSTVGAPPGQNAAIAVSITAGQYSSNAACGAISLVEVLVNGVATTIAAPPSGTTYTTTLSRPASGTPYNIQARVTEAGVRSVLSNVAVVTVVTNSPPVINSVASVGANGLIAGQSGTIRAMASDDGGSISNIVMSVVPVAGGSSTPASCSNVASCDLTFTPSAAGLYTVNVSVTDNGGATASSTTTVAVSAAPGVTELSLPSTVAIGTTAGQFAVSESGAATYSIPIAVAPGVNGLQPNLALTYNSQGGDGHLGVGWGLAGLSSITRCPKTIATDGIREPINYDNVTDPFTGNDAFCLDGQRLVPVSGGLTSVSCVWPPQSSSAANNSCAAWEFRTELDSYSRIIGIGDNTVAGSSGSGPTRFRVYTKAGQILEYGSRWWGIAAPRPDPQTSLIPNPSFEDTVVTDPATNPNIAYGQSYGLPASWGYFLTNSQANSQGWFFDGGTDPTYAPYSGAGVQRDGSAWTQTGPYSGSPSVPKQNAFVQRLGRLYTRTYLEAGQYRLTFKVAGRGTSGPNFGGNQTLQVLIDGIYQGSVSTTTGQAFTTQTMLVQVYGSGERVLTFAGTRTDDQTALLDEISLVPLNNDIYSVKVFPLDRVEDRSGNYMHVDYGGTHGTQYLINPDGTTTPTNGTVLSSYGTADIPATLPATVRIGLVAQGARPALEIFPRRLTYGMRAANPGAGTNRQSVGGVEIARVILNYEDRPDVSRLYDTGSGQMQLSKRLASIWSLVGGDDDTSLPADRENFHQNEINGSNQYGNQCTTGSQTSCGTLVRKYTLAYGQSASTQRSRLNSVTECSGDGLCLPATTFTWQDSTLTINSSSGSQPKDDGTDWNDLITNARVADIIGDGRSRIVRRIGDGGAVVVCTFDGTKFGCTPPPTPPSDPTPKPWKLPLNIDSSYQFTYEIPSGGVNRSWFMADLNGDGIADLVAITGEGKAFGCLSTGAGWGKCANIAPPPSGTRYYAKTGDFDGDGRIDIAFYRGNGQFEICRAIGGGNPTTVWSWTCNAPTGIQGFPIGFRFASDELDHLMIADFDGDGRADIAYRTADACVVGNINVIPPLPQAQCKDKNGQPVYPTTSDSYWSVCFARGKSDAITFQCATHSGGGINGAVKTVTGKPSLLATYDFNGDGLADLATYVPSSGGWRVCLSTADGEFVRKTDGTGECPIWVGPTETAEKTAAGDFNGDGRTDLIYYDAGSSQWRICVSTGSGFVLNGQGVCPPYASAVASPAILDGQAQIFIGDYNGDGKSDIAVNGLGTNGTLSYGFTESVMPDLVNSIKTGLQAETRINYQPLSSQTALRTIATPQGPAPELIYSKERPGPVADYPDPTDDEIVIQSPMYVVESTRASTGGSNGDWFKTEYRYAQLMANKWGRGLYGFRARNVSENILTDAAGSTRNDSNVIVTGYLAKNVWPNVGRPWKVTKSGSLGTTDSYGNRLTQLLSFTELLYAGRYRSSQIALTGGATARNPMINAFSSTYTIYEAFQVSSTQTGNDLNGAVLPTTKVFTGPNAAVTDEGANVVESLGDYYDNFGNPKKVVTVVETAAPAEQWTQTVRNFYYNNGGDTTRWLLGKLQYSVSESRAQGASVNDPNAAVVPTTCVSNAGSDYYAGGGTVNVAGKTCRKSSFTYQSYGGSCNGARDGQLCTETVEPDAATSANRTLYQQTAYEYDAFGNRSKSTVGYYENATDTVTKTRASTTTYQTGKYPLVTTRLGGDGAPDLADTRAYSDARCRLATKVTDANGNYATTEYDGFCRKVRETAWTSDGSRAKQTTFALDNVDTGSNPNGRNAAAESYRLVTTNSDGGQSITYYDNLQRTVRARAKAFDGSFSESRTVFDAYGRQTSTTKPASSGTTSGTATTSYEYDTLGRVVKETLPDTVNFVRTEYSGLVTRVIRTNSTGTVGGSIQPHVSVKTANAKGMVATVETGYRTTADQLATQTIQTTISNYYDVLGNLTRVTTPGANNSVLSKNMTYDLRGRQTGLADPDAGSYTYTYNGVGEQTSQTDSRGYVTYTSYDSLGRKAKRREGDAVVGQPGSAIAGGVLTKWTYDCANALGLLCTVTYDGTGGSGNFTSKATTYDRYSRPVGTTTRIDGKDFSSQIAYDALGRPRYAVYPQATSSAAPLAIETRYNAAGYADQTRHAVTGFIYQTITARNSDGQLNQASLAGTLLTQGNSYGSDGLARIAQISVTGGATLSQGFGFDSIGNLKSRSMGGTRTESEDFSYDTLDRLTGSTGSGGLVNDIGSYGYDSAGNLTSKATLGMGHTLGSNRLCNIGASTSCAAGSTVNVNYDGSGNITRYTRPTAALVAGSDGATITLAGYTAFNLPGSIEKSVSGSVSASAQFAYDAGYQRIRQVKRSGPVQTGGFVDDILYVVPGGFEVHRDQNFKVISSTATVSGPDGVIATVTTNYDPNTGQAQPAANATDLSGSNTVTRILLKDHLGSMVAEFTITAASGNTATAGTILVHGFGPWGNARNAASPLNVDQRGFTGHEHLADLGLIHMNGRLYDPVLGRFLQADPIIQAPHNAQSHNRYSYVLNNPLSFSDPSGFSWWTKNRSTILSIAAAALMQWYIMPELLLGTAFGECGIYATAGQAITAAASGFAAGGIAGGNIQSALQGAFFAGVTFGLASEFGLHGAATGWSDPKLYGQMALHSAVGCAQSSAAGGSCRAGAIGGGVSAFASPALNGLNGPGKLVASAIVGGIASRLSGGTFENGAMSAAFGYLFNEVLSAADGRAKYSGKSKGHHWIPFGALADMDISTEARAVFGLATNGISLPSEEHLPGHTKYNDAVRDLLKTHAKDSGINLAKMTAAEAHEFIDLVKGSRDPRISNLVNRVAGWTERFGGLTAGRQAFVRGLYFIGLAQIAENMLSINRACSIYFNGPEVCH